MKRVIIAAVAVAFVLASAAGIIMLISTLTSVPSGNIVNESFTFGADKVDKIEINVEVAYINVYKSTGALITVDLVEPKKELYTAAAEDGTLVIRESDSSWIDKLNRTDSDRYGIEIGIPVDKAIGLDIDAATSSVTVNGVTLVGNTEIAVTQGSITLNGINTDGWISTEIETGSVKLEYISCSEISADVDTGNIVVRAVKAERSISLTSDSGKITGVISGSRSDYRVTAHVDTGICDLESGGDGPVELIATVDTGTVALQFSGDPIR